MRKLALLSLCAFSLSSCSWLGMGEDEPAPVSYAGCPQVATIRDLTIYQHPPMANEDNLVITARMGRARGGCGGVTGGLQVDASVDIVALKGMNSAGRLANLPFFVSVVDANETVLRKDTYEIPVEFENGAQQLRMNVPFSVMVPLADGADGASMRVLVGYHLTQEQLDANSRFFGNTTPAVDPLIPVQSSTPAAPADQPPAEQPPQAPEQPKTELPQP